MTANDFREHIYNLVCGNYDLQSNQLIEASIVKNEFAEGSDCATAYSQMLDAYSRICQRLAATEWDDPDVEIIINELMHIGHQVALKMFDYGYLFGRLPDDICTP